VPKSESYYDILTAAISDLAEHGYDSVDRVRFWSERLRRAAEAGSTAPPIMEKMLRDQLVAIYRALVEKGGLVKYHGHIDRFTLNRIAPNLHAELDRRILASANLIRLNRQEAISSTLRRFQGWATSIPAGGSDAIKKAKEKAEVRKPLASLPFTERRVLIDQGHKLTAAINDIVAQDGGAIAAVWHSNWKQTNYDYREVHKKRDGKVYLIKNSWAQQKGFVKPGAVGYFEADNIDLPAQAPFCRCFASFIYSVSALPADMITAKGREALKRIA
jgi:hypothetical protein